MLSFFRVGGTHSRVGGRGEPRGHPDTMRKMTTEQKEVARTSGLVPAAGTKASGPDVEGELASRH